jgi:predicted transcriptional regulator
MSALADRLRHRLREAMRYRGVSQRDLAALLGWSQSKVGKVLTGSTKLNVEDWGEACEALRLPLVEAVRDPGLEFCATMTPTELRVLQHFQEKIHLQEPVMIILDVKKPLTPQRYATTPKAGPVAKARLHKGA